MKMTVVSMEVPSGGTSSSRRRAGTETPVAQILASRWRRLWKVSRTVAFPYRRLRSGAYYRRRGGVRRGLGPPDTRAAPPWAAPPPCVGPLWPSSGPSRVFWKLRGIIRCWELISSNSENISLLGFLKPKTAENRNWHFGISSIG